MAMRQLYLDYNATTPIAPMVQEAMLPFLAQHYGNPASQHALGRACEEAIEDARSQVAAFVGADRDEIVFTSSGTEANNLAVKGVLLRWLPQGGGHVVISALEHAAVSESARFFERLGCAVTIVPCDARGRIDPAAVESALRKQTRLVSVLHACGQIGTVQPIREIARRCHERDVLVHTDAAQTVGKLRLHVDELEVDLLSLSGHKFYGPKGIGALFVRRGTPLEPILHGAGQEGGLRSGMENVPHIVALGKAAMLLDRCVEEAAERLAMLRDKLFDRLSAGIGERLSVNGDLVSRLPNTLSLNLPAVSAVELLARTPEICATAGAAGGRDDPSRSSSLVAIGLSPQLARGTIRLSVGWYTSEEDIERAANLLVAAWEDLQ